MLFTRDREGDREHALKLLGAALEATTTIGLKPLARRVNSLIAKVSPPQTRTVDTISSSQALAGVSGQSQRIIATILFLDTVGSTEHVTKLRDRRWDARDFRPASCGDSLRIRNVTGSGKAGVADEGRHSHRRV